MFTEYQLFAHEYEYITKYENLRDEFIYISMTIFYFVLRTSMSLAMDMIHSGRD